MRKIILTILLIILRGACPVQAAIWWDSGHHVVTDANDPFDEIFMSDYATAVIFGGEIHKLEASDFSSADIFGGEIDWLFTFDNSVANIYGGTLDWLGAFPDSTVYLYAYDVTYHLTGGLENRPWAEGTYYSDKTSFSFTLYDEYSYSHVVVVPEPATFLLLGLGGLLLRKRK